MLFAFFALGSNLLATDSPAAEPPKPELFLQTGHSGMILAAAFSPDGRYVATVSGDRSARIWDAKTGLECHRFLGHTQMVMSVAFSPDGKQLLTGSLDKTARLWDVATEKELCRYEGETLMVASVAFSSDGRQVLTASYANGPDYTKGAARLWDAATGKLIQSFDGHDSLVNCAALSPDGRLAATGSLNGAVRLWNVETGREVRRLAGHAAAVRSIAFTTDGKLLATGADDKTARQWDATTGKEVHRFTAPGLMVFSVQVMPDGLHAGAAPLDGSAELWEIATGKSICKIQGHAAPVSCGVLSPDGRRAATGSLDGTARIWDAAAGTELHRLEGRCGEATAAAFSPDGKTILAAGGDGVVRLSDAATGRELRRFIGCPDAKPTIAMMPDGRPAVTVARLGALAFSPDGQKAITAAGGFMVKNQAARLWDLSTGKELQSFKGHQEGVNAVAFSPDGRLVATGGGDFQPKDASVRLWDAETGKELLRFQGHTGRITSVTFSPDGRRVLSGGWDAARLWDVSTGKEIRQFQPAPTRNAPAPAGGLSDSLPLTLMVEAVAFSPNGKQILLGGTDWTVRLFDAATGEEIRRFEASFDPKDVFSGQMMSIQTAAFSPDGKRIIAGTGDHRLIVWDAATGMEMRVLPAHRGAVNSVAFSPDGRKIVTAGEDGATCVWDAATGREAVRLIGLREGAEWVVVTPEGYFDASLDGRRLVTWRVGGELFPLESYEKQFHRPDLVAKALRGEPLGDVPSLPADRTPPKVGLQVEETARNSVTIRITAEAGSPKAAIVGIRVTVDGRDLPPKRGEGIVRRSVGQGKAAFRAVVDFPPGKPNALLAAMVTDALGLQSDPVLLLVERPAPPENVTSNLYVLTVGVSRYRVPQYNLNFCHADAEALAAALERQKGRAFADVRVRVLTNEKATAPSVLDGLNWLRKSCEPADVAVVLFSGHGALTPDGLRYLTYESDPDDLAGTTVNWRDVAGRMKALRARQILFFSDCCHAGAFGRVSASQDQLAESLVKEAGVMVFASSRGNETSAERGEWGHGAFVRALLDGLDGRADLIPNGRIDVSELQAFVVDRVRKLTDGAQHPYIPRLEQFDPGLVLAWTGRVGRE